jgi:alpha-D-xyloside xylohydrolase
VKRLLVFLAVLLVGPSEIFAIDAAVKSVAQRATEVVLTLDSGRLELRSLGENTIRVRFTDGKTVEKPSFVLTEETPVPKYSIRESRRSITVATAKIRAVVDRATGTVSFLDASGNLFLSEMAGTRSLKPVLV